MRCERCGSYEHVQKHHMIYGIQKTATTLYLCCKCHDYIKELHRDIAYRSRHNLKQLMERDPASNMKTAQVDVSLKYERHTIN